MKVSVVGTGYVGLSLAVLISRKYEVVAVDIVPSKVDLINSGKSPIVDSEIEKYLSAGDLKLVATTDLFMTQGSDYIIIATPTNYDAETQKFDTSSVEGVIKALKAVSPESTVVVKSTVPIGFTEFVCESIGVDNLLFSPEFLREGKALYDNLHPSRIIVGVPVGKNLFSEAEKFADLLAECSEESNVRTMVTGSTEAESVKLFSNTYLAMRVAYFNELDSFAEIQGLSSSDIITGVCLDPRIGNHYNNPSFGYGGYCLPKDTKQLLSNYRDVPNSLIGAIVQSNVIRKKFIADEIEKRVGKKNGVIGVYRLIMKSGSDNFRESSVIDVMKDLSSRGFEVVVYEPTIKDKFDSWSVNNDLKSFADGCELIIANRITEEISPYSSKVYCRDVFHRD